MRTMLLYGGCQVETMMEILRKNAVTAGLFRYVLVRNHALREGEAPPSERDFSECAILCEQADWYEFPYRERMPQGCKTVRFPSLDSLLMWPFNTRNPYSEPTAELPFGRFRYGDRVVIREIDRGRAARDIHAFYLNGWNEYKLDLDRVRELERVRLAKRDARCDVPAADLVLDRLASEQLFRNVDHPNRQLFGTFFERVLAACSAYEPALRHVDVHATIREHLSESEFFNPPAVPVHPEVAKALGLRWYDAEARYPQRAGVEYSYSQYFDEMIRYGIATKAKQLEGAASFRALSPEWQVPLGASRAQSEGTRGYFPDGFIGRTLFFHLIATAPISRLTVEGFAPAQHDGPFELECNVDGRTCASAEVQPGTAFTIECKVAARAGQRVAVEIVSSRVMNLFERGESEDSRDLSVLILSIAAV